MIQTILYLFFVAFAFNLPSPPAQFPLVPLKCVLLHLQEWERQIKEEIAAKKKASAGASGKSTASVTDEEKKELGLLRMEGERVADEQKNLKEVIKSFFKLINIK